jgi:hypothetical protein
MRRIYTLFGLIGLLLTINQTRANAKTDLSVPVEVTEIKDLGLSDRDESKSVIEVRWQINSVPKEKIASFLVVLSVTYADGTTISEKHSIEKNALSARIEIPSVKTFGGRNSAFIKRMNARVSAIFTKN